MPLLASRPKRNTHRAGFPDFLAAPRPNFVRPHNLLVARDQPRSSSVPIKSAGQTRLNGALVSASKEGLLPSGKSTM
jgi:hypothetical protein